MYVEKKAYLKLPYFQVVKWHIGGERGIRTLDKPFEPILP